MPLLVVACTKGGIELLTKHWCQTDTTLSVGLSDVSEVQQIMDFKHVYSCEREAIWPRRENRHKPRFPIEQNDIGFAVLDEEVEGRCA